MRVQDQFIDVHGTRTRYWQVGEGGVPLVLLHGLGGSIEDWAETIEPLARDRRVVAIDLIGCGKSDKPTDASYSLKAMGDHVVATLDALDLHSVVLNGWSLGGRIALDIAHATPERVDRLILTAPAGIGPDTILNLNAPFPDLMGQVATKPGASGLRIMRNAVRSGGSLRLMKFTARRFSLLTDGPRRAAFMKQLRTIVGPSGYLKAPRDALMDKLPQITTPTLAIWGRQDAFAPFAHSSILTARMPHCSVHAVDDCGHTPHIEWPELYIAAVDRFLS